MLNPFEKDAQLHAAIDTVQSTLVGNLETMSWDWRLDEFLTKVIGQRRVTVGGWLVASS